MDESTVADAARRRRAAAVAGHRRDAAAIRPYVTDPDGGVRATALGALHRAQALTTQDLRSALSDPEAIVRTRAAELVAELQGGGEAEPVSLLALLHDPEPSVVEVAAWALGERVPAEPGSVGCLAELASTAEDALIRESAVASLGSLGDTAGLPTILAALNDKATVRRRAVIALAPFDGPEVDAALEAALADRDWQVRQAAEDLSAE